MLLTACNTGGLGSSDLNVRVSSAQLTGGVMPKETTCDGGDHRPTVTWVIAPAARSIALLMTDPDAREFTHWTAVAAFHAGAPLTISETSHADFIEGKNGFNGTGYRGPCPPTGQKLHHYKLHIIEIGIDIASTMKPGFSRSDLDAVITTNVIATGELTGTYSR